MVIYPATTIRNRNTCAAYHRAVCHFFARFEEHVIEADIQRVPGAPEGRQG
jgi:hypothetical protein